MQYGYYTHQTYIRLHQPPGSLVVFKLRIDYSNSTCLSTISEILCNRRLSLFGHVARLDPEVPANKVMVNSHEGRKPSTSWTRPPGRPRRTGSTLSRRMLMLSHYLISMEN